MRFLPCLTWECKKELCNIPLWKLRKPWILCSALSRKLNFFVGRMLHQVVEIKRNRVWLSITWKKNTKTTWCGALVCGYRVQIAKKNYSIIKGATVRHGIFETIWMVSNSLFVRETPQIQIKCKYKYTGTYFVRSPSEFNRKFKDFPLFFEKFFVVEIFPPQKFEKIWKIKNLGPDDVSKPPIQPFHWDLGGLYSKFWFLTSTFKVSGQIFWVQFHERVWRVFNIPICHHDTACYSLATLRLNCHILHTNPNHVRN